MIDQKFLESLGVTDESAVQKITETYTADIQAEQDAAAATKTQLAEANKTIQSYKDLDIESIQKSCALATVFKMIPAQPPSFKEFFRISMHSSSLIRMT